MKKIIPLITIFSLGIISYGIMIPSAKADTEITVYKDVNCGCCESWIEHLQKAKFKVKSINSNNMQNIKKQYGVPEDMQSCHTAIINASGQVVEGHVPASAIYKLLESKTTKGIAVPEMPMNSPGMGQMDGQLITKDFNNQEFSKD